MPPRAAMGVWWTRWFNINAPDVQNIVDDYRSRGLPLDVFVLDMDWHWKPAWGSYTWDDNLFPDPADAIQGYLKEEEGLITLVRGHHVHCTPPLVVQEHEIREGIDILHRCLDDLDEFVMSQ